MELTTGRVRELEALVRWPAEASRRTPADVVHLAERTGLVGRLGAWVLDEACRNTARWRAEVPDADELRISVNISPLQVEQPDFDLAETTEAVLDRHGLPGSALWLEVTEGVALRDTERALDVLGRLHDAGVGLAVDDFGTGFSSLAYLERFPFDRLKIDQSFVKPLPHSPRVAAIVTAILALAGALDIDAVAEGVEETGHADALVALGCHLGQGYRFSPAVPARRVPDLLRAVAPRAVAARSAPPTGW